MRFPSFALLLVSAVYTIAQTTPTPTTDLAPTTNTKQGVWDKITSGVASVPSLIGHEIDKVFGNSATNQDTTLLLSSIVVFGGLIANRGLLA
ncbi:hypothetical protein K7432_008715 [Basidiobolus ranarum]|uniref:Uncharacterized protein n=1 Tax=Basidiobolus ranarum TaxID=34480 RepID=A0ABR2WRD1_9FUNG